jgi:hypothetical protein
MILNTIAEGMSLAKKLENESGSFYMSVAKAYPQEADTFQLLARENQKFIQQIERAYYGVITDALEGCFALNLESDNYQINTEIASGASYASVLNHALKMEEQIINFYNTAAEQCKSLMADVPRAFSLVARKRSERILKLKSLA